MLARLHKKLQVQTFRRRYGRQTVFQQTNAISTEIHVDRHVIMFYIHIHQGPTISFVMELGA